MNLDPHVKHGLDFLHELTVKQTDIVQFVIECRKDIERNGLPLGALVDLCYVLDQIAKVTDNVRKEAHKVHLLAEKVLCAAWTAQCAADPEHPGHVEGEIARGTPRMGLGANVPLKGTESYRRFLEHLGCPPSLVDADILRPHWPHMVDYMSKRASEGVPPPPGIDPRETYGRYELASLKLKRGVNIEEVTNG